MEEIKNKIRQAVAAYHEKHFYSLYPSGGPELKQWHLDAIAEDVIKPMQDEIDKLKAK